MKTYAPEEKSGRKLVWHDEFEKDVLDMSKWCFEHTMGAADREYINDEKHAFVKDGVLTLRVTPSDKEEGFFALPEGLCTKRTMNFKYGYLEMKCRIPYRKGAWPSFWMKSDTKEQKSEYMSEIDIFEVFSHGSNAVSNLHKWYFGEPRKHTMLPEGEGSVKRAYTFKNAENLNNEYHVYGMEWTPDYVAFFVDDEEYIRYSIREEDDFDTEVLPGMDCFKDFHYFILNDELFTPGSSWKFDPWITTYDLLPFDYNVEYVRLYQKDGEEIITY